MKRKIVIFVLVFQITLLNAQVLLSERFNTLSLTSQTTGNTVSQYTNAIPGFSVINDGYANNIGAQNNWNIPFQVPSLKNAGWVVKYNSNVNDTFLVSSSWLDDNTLTSDKWIITPTVNVSANTVLTWLAMSPDATHPDGYEVYGTNKPGALAPGDFTIGDKLWSIADGNTAGKGEKDRWTRRSFHIGGWVAPQVLRFAFRNNSKDMYQLWLDDIEVVNTTYSVDAMASSLENEKYFLNTALQTLTMGVTNKGAVKINTITLNYKYGTSPVNTQSFAIADGLDYLQSTSLVFPMTYSFSQPGYYEVKAWISLVNGIADNNLSNDTIRINVTAQASVPAKTIMLEQFVSAYDGESPDAQDKAFSVQSNSVVVVNIHDNDLLEEAASATLINSYKKQSSTGMLDRVLFKNENDVAVSKSNYQAKVYTRLLSVSPVSVSIINANYSGITKNLSFQVKADFIGEVKGDYRINAYLTENNVCDELSDTTLNGLNQLSNYYNIPWSPYYQKGYYSPGANGWVLDAWRFKHNNVLINMFDGAYGVAGDIPSNGGTQGQSYQKSYFYSVPSPVGLYKYNPNNMYIVAFVTEYNADETKRNVLNAARIKLTANPEVIGVKENESNSAIGIYPNPTSGSLFLYNTIPGEEVFVQLFDILGNCVYKQKIVSANGTQQLDISALANGVYFVSMQCKGTVTNTRIIVQKAD